MGIYSSIRQGEAGGSLISGFGSFFYQQGGSINVLKTAVDKKDYLHSMNKFYSFYSFILWKFKEKVRNRNFNRSCAAVSSGKREL